MNGDSDNRNVWWNEVLESMQAGHSAELMAGSGCMIDFRFRVVTLESPI